MLTIVDTNYGAKGVKSDNFQERMVYQMRWFRMTLLISSLLPIFLANLSTTIGVGITTSAR